MGLTYLTDFSLAEMKNMKMNNEHLGFSLEIRTGNRHGDSFAVSSFHLPYHFRFFIFPTSPKNQNYILSFSYIFLKIHRWPKRHIYWI